MTKAVKIKYTLISDQAPHFPEYNVKISEVPELLCDMVAHNCKQLWLLYYTIHSMTLLLVTFNDKLWHTLLKVAKEKYDTSNPKMPTQLQCHVKLLQKALEAFTKTHCHFVCEVPTVLGQLEIHIPSIKISPYATTAIFFENPIDYGAARRTLINISEDCLKCFQGYTMFSECKKMNY